MTAQPSSTQCPVCSKCQHAARWLRSPHAIGGGWHLRAWCASCECDPVPGHTWWSKSLLTAEEFAALDPPPEPRSTQLSLLDATNGNDGRDR